jgi:hypothetical protein
VKKSRAACQFRHYPTSQQPPKTHPLCRSNARRAVLVLSTTGKPWTPVRTDSRGYIEEGEAYGMGCNRSAFASEIRPSSVVVDRITG